MSVAFTAGLEWSGLDWCAEEGRSSWERRKRREEVQRENERMEKKAEAVKRKEAEMCLLCVLSVGPSQTFFVFHKGRKLQPVE